MIGLIKQQGGREMHPGQNIADEYLVLTRKCAVEAPILWMENQADGTLPGKCCMLQACGATLVFYINGGIVLVEKFDALEMK